MSATIDRPHRLATPVAWAVVAGALLLALVAFAGYRAGSDQSSGTTVRTGDFYVGDGVASGRVDGWGYGIDAGVHWVDAGGTSHDNGWPACLRSPGTTVRIRFGEVPVSGPDAESWRQVVWVDCRGATVEGR